jgi:hypothetical protein
MKKTFTMAAFGLLFTGAMAFGQATSSPTNVISVSVSAEAALTIGGDTALTSSGTNFADYIGTTNYTYFIRTGTGTGSINLKVTSDFSPANGPSVAAPPSEGDALKYTSTVSTPGNAISGVQTASTASTTGLATFGADAHSAKAGNSGSIGWTLTNDPVYKTGSYSATVTYTISAS